MRDVNAVETALWRQRFGLAQWGRRGMDDRTWEGLREMRERVWRWGGVGDVDGGGGEGYNGGLTGDGDGWVDGYRGVGVLWFV